MQLVVAPSRLAGEVEIPGSKSHTIRAVVLASLASGTSRIVAPLDSSDTRAALDAARLFGAEVSAGEEWIVTGTAGRPVLPVDVVDVGNSGTTLRIFLGVAALCDGWTFFTGDEQTKRRPLQPLIDAYRLLGAEGFCARGNGCAPAALRGRITGGRTEIRAVTSQFLSSLLVSAPLAERDTEIRVLQLNEAPYVEMTLAWLEGLGVVWERRGWERFSVRGGQGYRAFERRIPGDFSSATFFLCAAAATGSELLVRGLDTADVQGDRAVVGMLAEMGAKVEPVPGGLRIRGGDLRGAEFDLNATPDALPALAAAACFASGETRLRNVPQARLKETDRIAVMTAELARMGAKIRERPDGLEIEESRLKSAEVYGHHDHRVVMALAVAASAIEGRTIIHTAEAMQVTFPTFVDCMSRLGGRQQVEQDP